MVFFIIIDTIVTSLKPNECRSSKSSVEIDLNKLFSKRDRNYLAFSLCLSERLNEHIELDLYILDIDPKNPAYLAKVQKNEQEFPKFLGKFMPKWVTVEQDLWVLTKKVMGKDKSVANLWFLYCKHNKLNYSLAYQDVDASIIFW